MKRLTGFIVLLVAMAAVAPVEAQAGAGTVTPMECPYVGDMTVTFECGRVTVPEDHARPDGPTIQIAYAIAHSLSNHSAPDPVVFIGGGPGAATIENMAREVSALVPVLEERDVIFFDQRGLGYSSPRLDCDGLNMNVFLGLVGLPPAERDPALQALVRECRASLDAQGLNLDVYTSAQIAGDIDALGTALGYDEINLYGVSYGTRIALTMLRDRPDRVRSVVLDSTLPLEVDVVVDSVTAMPQMFEDLFDDCAADPVCRITYPNLETVFVDTVNRLGEQPITVEVEHPVTGEKSELVVDDDRFVTMMAALLSLPPAVPLLPSIIYDVSEGDADAIAGYYEIQLERTAGTTQDVSLAMGYAVLCVEEVPFNTSAEIAAAQASNRLAVNLDSDSQEFLKGVCDAWGVGSPDPKESQPVRSDVPVLMLSGLRDAVTPPRYAEQVHAALGNSTLVTLPTAAHGVSHFGECPALLTAQFLNAPDKKVDTSCVEAGHDDYAISAIPARRVARPIAMLAGVVGLAMLVYPGKGLAGLLRRRQVALTATRKRAGWLALALSVGLTAATLGMIASGRWEQDAFEAVAMIIPPIVAMHIALLVTPFNEPGLEMLLAAPRPFHWLALERTAYALLMQLPVMVAGMWIAALLGGSGSALVALAGMLVATLFLSGLAVFAGVRSGQVAMGCIIMLLTWFVFMAGSDHLLPVEAPALPWNQPMTWLQPFLWFVHPYLRAGSLTAEAYLYNRLIVSGLGITLFSAALRDLSDTERLLLKAE